MINQHEFEATRLPQPDLASIGFSIEPGEVARTLADGSEITRDQALQWWLDSVHAVAADPESKQESLATIRQFIDTERDNDPGIFDDEARHAAGMEVADFAQRFIASYGDTAALRIVMKAGLQARLQEAFRIDDDFVAKWMPGSAENAERLGQAVSGTVRLAQALYAQNNGIKFADLYQTIVAG